MVDMDKFYTLGSYGIRLTLRNPKDLSLLINNKNEIQLYILDLIQREWINSIDIVCDTFYDEEFLKKLANIDCIDNTHFSTKGLNVNKVKEIFKDKNVDLFFDYEFDPNSEEYYDKNLYSFTNYPCYFKMYRTNQYLIVDKTSDIDTLAKLVSLKPDDAVTLTFNDLYNFKKVIDNIPFKNLCVYLTPCIKEKQIEYIHDKYPNVQFLIKRVSIYDKEAFVSYEDIKDGNDFLNQLINEVKSKNLTPFEQFTTVYNFVKHFKKYKDVDDSDNPLKSRSLYLILHNEYIVCAGYATLLEDLISKLDNPNVYCFQYNVIYTRDGEVHAHARNIVFINDPEYGINNYFVCDPTWDAFDSHESDRIKNSSFKKDESYDWYTHLMITPQMAKEEYDATNIIDIYVNGMNLDYVDTTLNLAERLPDDEETIKSLLLTEYPKEKVEKVIDKVYKVVYKNYSDRMVKHTIKNHRKMFNIIYGKKNNKQKNIHK